MKLQAYGLSIGSFWLVILRYAYADPIMYEVNSRRIPHVQKITPSAKQRCHRTLLSGVLIRPHVDRDLLIHDQYAETLALHVHKRPHSMFGSQLFFCWHTPCNATLNLPTFHSALASSPSCHLSKQEVGSKLQEYGCPERCLFRVSTVM